MKQNKRGFTIVELVIVIAVIAVLAAVLIPTFSSLIKKANLSADMQAVREMNIALAADEAIYGKPDDVETVMQVLANAGYNTKNWKCITTGYEVYWYKKDNRMVLYSTKEGKLIYPTEYDASLFLDQKSEFIRYNQNEKDALELDTSLSSSETGGKSISDISSSASGSEKVAIESVNSAVTGSSAVISSLGLDGGDVYINANKELRSDSNSENYAAMQIMQVSNSQEVKKTSSGEVAANVFFISVNTAANATAAQIEGAQKAASEYVYSVFTQINTDKIDMSEGVTILMPAGTEINASAHEWKPVKSFCGYFGTTDAANPVVINGAKLTKATGYLDTVYFEGSGGKYFVTGFFGSVYGESTIENVTFRNLSMNEPGSNYDMTLTTKQHSRNSVGIIGGVIDDPASGSAGKSVTDVVVRNIVVEDNVTIKGSATAAGLIAYVGASGDKDIVNKAEVSRRLFNGKLLIENCKVHATVIGGPETSTYGPCAGLVGFACRVQEEATGKDDDGKNSERFTIIIKDCLFDGKVTGYQGVGAAIGDMQSGSLFIFQGTNDFTGATLENATEGNADMLGVIGSSNPDTNVVVYFSTGTINKPADMKAIGKMNGVAVNELTDIDKRTAAQKYDTVKKGDDNIGGNNGKIA